MKVKKTIRVRKETVNELLKQECVERIEQWHDGNIVVKLLPGYTDGKPELRKGEYILCSSIVVNGRGLEPRRSRSF